MPKITKVSGDTVKKARRNKQDSITFTKKEDNAIKRQKMYSFKCPVCGGIAKAISRNVEFFCGIKDHKGTPMEFIK